MPVFLKRPTVLHLLAYAWVLACSAGHWLVRHAYHPVAEYLVETWVGVWEESTKSLVRECFQALVRLVNGLCGWVVSKLDTRLDEGWTSPVRDLATWEKWRPSTFNWLVERHQAEQGVEDVNGGGSGPSEDCLQGDAPEEGEDGDSKCRLSAGAAGGSSSKGTGWTALCSHWNKKRLSIHGSRRTVPSFVEIFGINTGAERSLGEIGRGWVEDLRLSCEVAITWFFNKTRWLVRSAFLLPRAHSKQKPSKANGFGGSKDEDFLHSHKMKSLPSLCTLEHGKDYKGSTHKSAQMAVKLISDTGYPLEVHDVITNDQYKLTVHRLPRPESRDVVFFQHGILDTSISWCSNGVPRSFAFRAYEAGYDVWLGNCRANPPRQHENPDLPRHQYWNYSLNELGLQDVRAQLEHIHTVKCSELEGQGEENIQKKDMTHNMGSLCAMDTSSDNADKSILRKRIPMSACQSTGSLDLFFAPHRNVQSKICQPLQRQRGTCGEQAGSATVNFEFDVKEEASGVEFSLSDENNDEQCAARREAYRLGRNPDHDSQQDWEQKVSNRSEPEQAVVSSAGSKTNSTDSLLEATSSCTEASVPYTLRAVGHSLGGAALLIHLIMALRRKRPHRLHRLVLLSPAGFHHKYPLLVSPLLWLLPFIKFVWTRLLRREGLGLMIPGRYPRMAIFKSIRDVVQIPGLRKALKLVLHSLLGGDGSPWDFAMQLPHYDVDDMPGISLDSGLHLVQLIKSKKFQLFDYKDAKVHQQCYDDPRPLDIASEYNRIDIPVDIVAGTKDGIIPPACVQMHHRKMLEACVNVSYREFDYSHLEFSFSMQDDLASYVINCLDQTVGLESKEV